jgi:uncharacterized membrane protein
MMVKNKNLKIISLLGLLFSILGLADSIYLTIAHYTAPTILACPESKFINCARVTTSQYSTFHGIPIVFFGLLFFLIMLILQSPIAWKSSLKLISIGRLVISSLALISVFGLVYIELDKLNAICLYCTGVHILTFALFVTTIIGSVLLSQNNQPISEQNQNP